MPNPRFWRGGASTNVYSYTIDKRTCFPMLVRPRASRRLCTGLTIHEILGSRRIFVIICRPSAPKDSSWKTYCFVVGVNKDNLVVLVDTILIYPVRVQHPQISTPLPNTLLSSAPETTLELQVVDTLTNGFAVGGTWTISLTMF